MVIFGSMYQLIPVVLEVRVYSERMANIQFWIFSLGTVGLVYGFWSFNVGYLLAVSASLVTVGVLLFIVNVLATMSCITKWNLTGLFLLTAVAYLALTAVAGLLLAVNLGFPFISRIHLDYLKIHAHVAFIGWVFMVIMGVGLKLIPMFGLSHGYSTVPSKVAYVCVNLGLAGVTVEWLFAGPNWLLQLYVGVLVFGILGFFVQLILIFRHRLRRYLDLGMKHSAAAFFYLLAATLTGGYIAFAFSTDTQREETVILAYGFTILLGFFSTLIVGQLYKIIPFLVWFHTFSDKAGKEKVPMLKDMVYEKVGTVEFWLLNAGVLLAVAGILKEFSGMVCVGLALLLCAALLFAYNIVHVFRIKASYGDKGTGA